MYAVLSATQGIIGWHEEMDVCELYIENTGDDDLVCIKVKKKELKKLIKTDIEDYYLVRYNMTYLQRRFVDCVEIASISIIDAHRELRDNIYNILHLSELTKKERRILEKTCNILSNEVLDDEIYTPTYSQCLELEDNQERWAHQVYY